eukprot:297351-Prorocentrum_minimum.AAC.1
MWAGPALGPPPRSDPRGTPQEALRLPFGPRARPRQVGQSGPDQFDLEDLLAAATPGRCPPPMIR